jgi:tetratricopeptide (TPR) repeat protein
MKRTLQATALLTLAASAAAAQQPVRDTIVAKAVANYTSRYVEPDCKLPKGHFKVSSAATYLKSSVETSVDANRERMLEDGQRVSIEAIQQNGQDKNPAAWYFLGRIYLRRGDVAGADSALRKAQELAPDCAGDIAKYRRVAFAPIINRAIDFSKNHQDDSALVYYRRAAAWMPNEPISAYNLAGVFASQKMEDSALVYYEAAIKGATDTTAQTVKIRNQSAYNRAVLLARAQRYPEAVTAFTQYLQWVPDDADAKKGLVASLRGAGMADSASAMEKKLGVTAGNPAAAGPATGAAADYNAAATAFNEKRYADALTSVDKFLTTEPNSREGLYIRARALYELKRGPDAVKAANALLAVDPMSESAVQLLGAAYNITQNSDMAVKTRLRLNALPISLSSVTATPSGGGVALTATVTGRAAKDDKMKPIAPAPMTLVFEFLNAQGAVVAEQEASIPALKPGEQFQLKLEVQGQGVTSWRYHKK